jgi:hypothetical protein
MILRVDKLDGKIQLAKALAGIPAGKTGRSKK